MTTCLQTPQDTPPPAPCWPLKFTPCMHLSQVWGCASTQSYMKLVLNHYAVHISKSFISWYEPLRHWSNAALYRCTTRSWPATSSAQERSRRAAVDWGGKGARSHFSRSTSTNSHLLPEEGIHLLMYNMLTGLVFNEISFTRSFGTRAQLASLLLSGGWNFSREDFHRSFAICGSMQDSKKSQHPIPVNLPWFYVKHRPFLRILSRMSKILFELQGSRYNIKPSYHQWSRLVFKFGYTGHDKKSQWSIHGFNWICF